MVIDRQMRRTLLSAILADPEADVPCLVYADWLEEQGDPLAELVRVQCRLRRENLPRREMADLEERQNRLLAGFGFDRPARREDEVASPFFDWSFGVNGGVVTLFLHGMPPGFKHMATPPREWVERFGWFIIRVESAEEDDHDFTLSLRGLEALLASPLMDHCIGLDLSSLEVPTKAIQKLARSPAVQGLFTLDLRYNHFDHRGAVALAKSKYLSSLLYLELSQNPIGDDG